MKKYIWIIAGLFVVFFLYEYSIYHYGFYVFSYDSSMIHANVTTKDSTILVKNDPFEVKGVIVSAAIPNYKFSDYELNEEEYLAWMLQIQEMGANTIYVTTLMDADFYDALYTFNTTHIDTPLYILQGVRVSDYGNNTPKDAYDRNFYDILKEDARSAVDILHGRKNILLNRGRGYGYYRKDVSPWVLGIQLGDYFHPSTIAYTNHNHNATSYDGTYVQTTADANAFEALLASLMDDVLRYEGSKYGMQSLICFRNDPTNDPFQYDAYYAGQLSKYVEVDATHIQLKDTAKSGMIASYNVYEFIPNFASYFDEEQKKKLAPILETLDTSRYYEGYTELLCRYYEDMPVLISDYGFSTARGSDTGIVLNEQEQGHALVKTYQDFIASGCAGGIINSWQDAWDLRTWNTIYAVDVNRSMVWEDIQSQDHGYGILSFPSTQESAVIVDGRREEWTVEDVLQSNDDMVLSIRQDIQGIYLFIQKPKDTMEDALWIPFDITPKSGSFVWEEKGIAFSRDADFILVLENGEAHVYVQSRYEALRSNYQAMIDGTDPYIDPPAVDDPSFVEISMIQKKTVIRENLINAPPVFADTYETGRLRLGTLDTASSQYDSQSDYAIGNDGIEVRIPWQMLNFADPTHRLIHDDYYENYGIETIAISSIYAGLGSDATQVIQLAEKKLQGFQQVETTQRLKQSYEIIQEAWR